MSDLFKKLKILCWCLTDTYMEWVEEIWKRDLNENHCCDGRECCCGGASIDELWSYALRPDQEHNIK